MGDCGCCEDGEDGEDFHCWCNETAGGERAVYVLGRGKYQWEMVTRRVERFRVSLQLEASVGGALIGGLAPKGFYGFVCITNMVIQARWKYNVVQSV